MEIKKRTKFADFMKNYGTLLISGLLIVVIAVTLLIVGLSPTEDAVIEKTNNKSSNSVPTSSQAIEYAVPMNNASVIKDFSLTELQYNQTLNCWEAHLSVDMISMDNEVMAIYNGTVTSVEDDFLKGNVVTITHENGLVSVYASLDDNLKVEEGDKVTKGQVIGYAGTSATSEVMDGAHLDFAIFENGEEVDPNNYLNLQNK